MSGIAFLYIIAFLVYPEIGVNPSYLYNNLKELCKNVRYFEVGDVFSVGGCTEDKDITAVYGVKKVEGVKTYRLPDIDEIDEIKITFSGIDTLPWYVKNIHMYDRDRMGLSGKGVVCGILDTGIDTTSPYLARSFLNFYDAVGDSSLPYDDNGHGTAVASLISGQYGIAPETRLAVCKGFRANGVSDDTTILKCAQWFFELKRSGLPLMVINNSWGEVEAEYMVNVIKNWDSLGILTVFSAGNNGPYYRRVDAPSVYPITFSIGATTSSDTIAWFSSRGPAPDTGIFADVDLWPVVDWNYTKPDFVAPGDYIYVTLPRGYYGIVSGTSFATPVFSGALCLLKEAEPSFGFKDAYKLIKNRAVVKLPGLIYPDSAYGFGRIDIGKLVDALMPKVIYDSLPYLLSPAGLEVSYRIYTVDGRLVGRGKTHQGIILSGFPSGTYIIKMFLNNHEYTTKFVKIK